MGALSSIYNFLFALPALPEPCTKNPAVRSDSLDDIMGVIGLADQMPRLTPGSMFNLPMLNGPDGLLPYLHIDVGSRDRLLRVSLRHWDDDSELHIHIRQNPDTEAFYVDKIDNIAPHAGINHVVPCDAAQITEDNLREILGVMRLAVTRMRQGVLEDLRRTHSELVRLSPASSHVAPPQPS